MLNTLDEQGSDLAEVSVCDPIHDPIHDASHESTSAASGELDETPTDSSDNSDHLWTLAELSQRYSCSTRNVQNMFSACQEARPDLNLKQKQGRKSFFTHACVTLLDSLKSAREQGTDTAQWVVEQQSVNSQSQESPVPAFVGQLAASSDNSDSQLVFRNPFLNGIGSEQAIDEGITDIETRIELIETRKMERSEFQNDLSSRIKTLALKGYQQGVLESEEGKDEFAVAYEQAAQEEIERIEREQRLEAIRAQARRDVQEAYDRSKKLGNEL